MPQPKNATARRNARKQKQRQHMIEQTLREVRAAYERVYGAEPPESFEPGDYVTEVSGEPAPDVSKLMWEANRFYAGIFTGGTDVTGIPLSLRPKAPRKH